MVIMASGIARGCVRTTAAAATTTTVESRKTAAILQITGWQRDMQPWFIAYFFGIGHPCYDQLTPVKTRYPLTSIMWPYRGLKLTAHRGTELKNDCACVICDPVGSSAGKSRLKQQIPNVKSITERWPYFVDFLPDFESFYFPKRFIYLRGIAFSGHYRWNFRKARDFVYFIDPLLCIVASRAAFSRHGLLTSR